MKQPSLSHRLEYGAYRLVRAVVRVLPEAASDWAVGILGGLAGSVVRIRRRDADANLARAFPERSARWRHRVARATYRHLAREGLMTFRLSRMPEEEVFSRTSVEGIDDLRRALGQGKGVVVVSAHLGNWEIGAAALAVRSIPVDVIAFRQKNPLFDHDLVSSRRRLGVGVIVKGDAARTAFESLRSGRVVATAADQNIRHRGVFVDYFGTPAATPKGPALFALRTGAPIFLGIALRQPGARASYRVVLTRVPTERDHGERTNVQSITERYTALLESYVRRTPEQYLWQHRRWKTRPPEVDADESGEIV